MPEHLYKAFDFLIIRFNKKTLTTEIAMRADYLEGTMDNEIDLVLHSSEAS